MAVAEHTDEEAEQRVRERLDAELNRLTDDLDGRLGLENEAGG
jgi:hypothetical protein